MNANKILRGCDSWSNLNSQIRGFSDKEKGDCFEALTEHYLRLEPKYVSLLKTVWPLRKVPVNIGKRLNLPGPDEGIDLIAETKDGKFWAIQCKYFQDNGVSLTRQKLSTFFDLSFNICKNISFCLVCTTADRFSYKLSRYGEKLGFCAGDIWRGLDTDFFKRLHRLLDGKVTPLASFKPRPHQRRAIRNAYVHFIREKNRRGKLIMPCGTGKTLAAFWIAEKLKARTVLIAVPSLALIRQTLEVWAREFVAQKRNVQWIAVCSDESVGDIERDDAVLLTQDLGIQVNTNPREIVRWLNQHRNHHTIVFTTYQSGATISHAARMAGIVFDIGILDEAHKTVGRRDGLFSHLLFDKNIRIRKRIFMTATERRYRGQSDQLASMDDTNLYGDTFECLTFKRALEARPPILSDYKVVTLGVTRKEIALLIKQNLFVKPDKGRWNKDVEAEMLAALIAQRKAMRKHPIRHAVSFHSRITRAKVFKDSMDNFGRAFPNYGKLKTFHVFGKMPTSARSAEMALFAATNRALVTNARCLTEGVDVPNIDGVLFADPKRSTVDIVQAVGRALRPSSGKRFGYVVVPVLIDGKNTTHEIIPQTAFDNVLMVLRALGANDERIIEYFRGISQGRRPTRGAERFSIDIPAGLKIDAARFANSIELQLWSRLAKLSWRPFEEARAFVHRLILQSGSDWYRYYRGQLHAKGKLPSDIPATPHMVYKDKGWISWGDWLGTGYIASQAREFRPFKEARAFVHRLKLEKSSDWYRYCRGELHAKGKLPLDIPAHADRSYKGKGWISWGDWLGTENISSHERHFRPFKQARAFVHQLKLRNLIDWHVYCRGELHAKGKLPSDIPTNPLMIYKDKGWAGMGDWLGTGTIAPRLRQYRPFKQARAFVHRLKLQSRSEWQKYCFGELKDKGKLPSDIPAAPEKTYKDRGWAGMGDWLGTGTIAPFLRKYRPFKQARAFVHQLKLRNMIDWHVYCRGELHAKGKLPSDIPTNPHRTYKQAGWVNYGDWLGTGYVAQSEREYRSFKQARTFVHRMELRSQSEWRKYCLGELHDKGKLPSDIPTNPQRSYKDMGWVGWGDWLGTGTIAPRLRQYRQFEQARVFVHRLKLRNRIDWHNYCRGGLHAKGKLPSDIPANPHVVYKDKGWAGLGDWLGTGTIAPFLRQYRRFEQARAFVHRLKLKKNSEWRRYSRGEMPNKPELPKDIPGDPSKVYKGQGWMSWGDWLGTGAIAPRERKFRLFKQARTFVHRLKLKNHREWLQYCHGELSNKPELPIDIPRHPDGTYKDGGWISWGDWLGTGAIWAGERKFRPFKQARDFVHRLELKNHLDWVRYCRRELNAKQKRPYDIPTNPHRTYKDKGWIGWGDWLGTGNISPDGREYRPFQQARDFVHRLKLRRQADWNSYLRAKVHGKRIRPLDIPSNPEMVYKDKGWSGYRNWLGNE